MALAISALLQIRAAGDDIVAEVIDRLRPLREAVETRSTRIQELQQELDQLTAEHDQFLDQAYRIVEREIAEVDFPELGDWYPGNWA